MIDIARHEGYYFQDCMEFRIGNWLYLFLDHIAGGPEFLVSYR
jgi:hypothetical protein